ncbi:unnamed protein product, partial [Candidula unifasciata]
WFHPNITGRQAEKLLMDKGQDWSFLVRPSSTKDAYTISVRHNDEVTHIKIQNTGDSYDLCGEETFATLSELVQYYMENQDQLKEKNGAPIKLKYPLASDDPTPERWFHSCLTGREADRLLLDKGKNCSFLVRQSRSKPGDFVISVRSAEDRISHVKIRSQNGKYDVGGGEVFDSLSQLVEHYKKSPMVDTSGTVVYIKHQLQQAEFIGERFSREQGNTPENKAKNRYKNILPYDYTRVVLADGDETLGTDYINANHITWTGEDHLIKQNRRYIATQGPLVSTMLDFYRMIWQEGSRVIINLARITERGKVQINIYWPSLEDSSEKVFVFERASKDGSREFVCQYRVRLINEAGDDVLVLREMLLSKEDEKGKPLEEPRKLFQFHYMVWPDYNVPEDPGTMIDFLERTNNLLDSLPSPGPVIVHCSAGIGRTGTLIVIDMIISQIKTYGFDCDIDIFNTILMVRGQRSGLVQTQCQYQFVYLAVERYLEVTRQRHFAVQAAEGDEYTNIKSLTEAKK